MKKKYGNKAGGIILWLFIAAAACVIAAVVIAHQSGVRYIKSDTGVKFFGSVDTYNNDIISGRIWSGTDSAKTDE